MKNKTWKFSENENIHESIYLLIMIVNLPLFQENCYIGKFYILYIKVIWFVIQDNIL